ncbi:MAG: hypothetical protein ONB13_01410 [candidate division KSB1 bacterium]|nr:hypothetical protein [candidate division KSB1 bacterium]MDZ7333993.1 hypothetical protein [candidate division KSB1 bacterium]MDZ7357967.1 hypothetical protein [candidate division KSB1 bacterium]MDZ7375252.1 hypothetical protein [candidate division KSB1 bacterium]MDZ7399978.1 hypothetical protein [candidate division KSB1 bacterium]
MIQKTNRILFLLFGLILLLPYRTIAQEKPSTPNRNFCCWSAHWNLLSPNRQFNVTLSDSWFGRDKVHHFLTSAFLSAAGYYVLRDEQKYANRTAQAGCLTFSISMGLAKEIRDGMKPQNAFSVKDLVADVLGAALGLAIVADF